MNDEENLPYAQEITSLDNIDWKQYFDDFCEAHGKYPIVHTDPVTENRVLLFPDGYRYSCDNYEGPEYPPPLDKNKLRQLKRMYWMRRRIIVSSQYRDLDQLIRHTEALIKSRSVPIKISKMILGDEGKYDKITDVINIEDMKRRLNWLMEDTIECDKKIKELSNES